MAERSSLSCENPKQPSDHRQLLANLNDDQYANSGTEPDDFSDDTSTHPHYKSHKSIQDDLVGVGVSIGPRQTYMKSAHTPAIEKSQALQESDDYFNITESAENTRSPTPDEATELAIHGLPLPGPAGPPQSNATVQEADRIPALGKLPLSGSSVQNGISENRWQRSSSGSMLAGLRNMLPDLPSFGGWRMAPPSVHPTHDEKPKDNLTKEAIDVAAQTYPNSLTHLVESEVSLSPPQRSQSIDRFAGPSHSLDGSVESLLGPGSPASPRGRHLRTSSAESLYLTRKTTGVSTYDDTTAFAEIREMQNSRFKAIQDSLQNSTLRMPKLPAIISSNKHRGTDHKAMDRTTRQNTQANAGQVGKYEHRGIKVPDAKDRLLAEHVQTPQQRAHPILSNALAKTEGDIIIMGGYRGSVLRDAKPPHRQLWAPVKVGLNLRNVDLSVGLTREDEERAHEKIIPSGILSHIGPIDISRRLLKHLKKCPNTREGKLRVHDWGYDWRLSPDLLSQRLIKLLESLQCNHPDTPRENRGAFVIAHSLGGLITRHAVNQRPELFAGVVFAGAPQNCCNILGPLRNGDDVLLSSRVLTAQVNFTMRTSFALLPEDGRCFIQKHTNKRFDLDFFDPQTWEDYRLSPCISPALPAESRRTSTQHQNQHHRRSLIGSLQESVTAALPPFPNAVKRGSWFGASSTRDESPPSTARSTIVAAKDTAENAVQRVDSPQNVDAAESSLEPSMRKTSQKSSIATAVTIPKEAAQEYLQRTLREVLAFKQALAFKEELQKDNKYPPHAFIFGKTVPTVYGARVASKEDIKYSDAFDDLAFAAGDGVVLASAAQLPEGYKCVKGGRVETDRGHVGLLGDLEGVGRCLAAVVEARKKGVGWGNYPKGDENGK